MKAEFPIVADESHVWATWWLKVVATEKKYSIFFCPFSLRPEFEKLRYLKGKRKETVGCSIVQVSPHWLLSGPIVSLDNVD